MRLYFSESHRDELIELSDERILWYVQFANEETDEDYDIEVRSLIQEFQQLYDTELLLAGRSGRHICVENTPANRCNLCRMQKTVYRMQNQLLQQFDAGWRINKYGLLYHKNGTICIGYAN